MNVDVHENICDNVVFGFIFVVSERFCHPHLLQIHAGFRTTNFEQQLLQIHAGFRTTNFEQTSLHFNGSRASANFSQNKSNADTFSSTPTALCVVLGRG